MVPTPSQKAQQISLQLADLPPSEQEAALRRLCGDDAETLSEVRSLLDARPRTVDFVDRGPVTIDSTDKSILWPSIAPLKSVSVEPVAPAPSDSAQLNDAYT